MPSSTHEVLIELFRHRPTLAAELLAEPFDMDLPPYERVRVESADLGDLLPTEYRADVVTVLQDARGQPVLAIVVEVQLAKDPGKRWSWPVYLATLRARLRCPTVLLVVCLQPAAARWCASPIPLGQPGWVLTPLVLGPGVVPTITDPEEAVRSPELSVLSALAHGAGPDGSAVLKAMLGGFSTLDEEHVTLYSDVVLKALPAAARQLMEALVNTRTYEYQSDFVRRYVFQGRDEGRVEAKADAVLAVLDARGLAVGDGTRKRIAECTDRDQLDQWIRRAATVDSVDELFV